MKKVAVTRVDKNEFFSDEKELIMSSVVRFSIVTIVTTLSLTYVRESGNGKEGRNV